MLPLYQTCFLPYINCDIYFNQHIIYMCILAMLNITEYDFDPAVTSWYLIVLSVNPALSLPAHSLLLYMAIFHTPKDMFNYRITVSNTTTWSILVIIWYSLILRPVPLFPYPVGLSFGPTFLIHDYRTAMIHFGILMFVSANCLAAMIICFTTLVMFLMQNSISKKINRHVGMALGFSYHIFMTIFILVIILVVYQPTEHLESILACTPLGSVAASTNGQLFGYVPNMSSPVLSFIVFALLGPSAFVFIGITGHVLYTLNKILNRHSNSRTTRSRWNTALMLTSRTLNPVMLLVIPLAVCCLMVFLDIPMFKKGLFCAGLWAIHGLINAFATIAVFQPYRKKVRRMFCMFVKGKEYVK